MYTTFLLFYFQIFKVCSSIHSHTERAPYWHWYEKSFSLWHSGSPSLEGQSDGPLSPSDIHPSSNPKQLMLSGVPLLAISKVNNPVGFTYGMWSAHFFVTHVQTEKISSWNVPTFHVCCFMLARASTEAFVSRVQQTAIKIFVSRKITLKINATIIQSWVSVFVFFYWIHNTAYVGIKKTNKCK